MNSDFDKNFDVNVWEEECKKYDRNHAGLNFTVRCSVKNEKLAIELDNLEDKYKAPILKLMQKNMTGAVIYLNSVFRPWYAADEDDYEEAEETAYAQLRENIEFLINVLFTQGFESFVEEVSKQVTFLNARYELTHCSFSNGELKKSDGSLWKEYGWEKDGTLTESFITVTVLKDILQTSKKQKIA